MAKKTQKGAEFVVKLDNIELDADAINRLQSGFQRVVMDELVGYKPDPDAPYPPKPWPWGPLGPQGPLVFKPYKQWYGFIIKRLAEKDLKLIQLDKDMIETKFTGR